MAPHRIAVNASKDHCDVYISIRNSTRIFTGQLEMIKHENASHVFPWGRTEWLAKLELGLLLNTVATGV